jgi:hypothetical protein
MTTFCIAFYESYFPTHLTVWPWLHVSVWRQSMPTIVVMRYTFCTTYMHALLCSPSEVTAAICYLKRECMYEKDGSRRRLFVSLYSSLWVSKPVVIKEFHPKEGAWERAKKVLSSCEINLICPSYDSFSATPCSVHRVDAKHPVFRERTLISSFVFTLISSFSNRC